MDLEYGTTGASWIAVHPDGGHLAVATREGRVLLWDTRFRQLTRTIRRSGHVTRLGWVEDGAGLIIGGADGSLRRYGDLGKTLVAEVDSGHGMVRGLSVHPSSRRLATCGSDGHVRVWRCEGDAPLALAWENGAPGTCFDSVAMLGIADPEAPLTEDALVAGWDNGRFAVFSGPGKEGGLLSGGGLSSSLCSAAARPGGGAVVVGAVAGGVLMMSTSMTEQWPTLMRWSTPPRPIAANAIAFSSDGARFAVAASDGAVHLFDPDGDGLSSRTLGTPFYHRDPKPEWSEQLVLSGVCFDPGDDGRLYTCCLDGSVQTWRVGDPGGGPELLFDSNNP